MLKKKGTQPPASKSNPLRYLQIHLPSPQKKDDQRRGIARCNESIEISNLPPRHWHSPHNPHPRATGQCWTIKIHPVLEKQPFKHCRIVAKQ